MSRFFGDYLAVELDCGDIVNVCFRDSPSFKHGLLTFRLPLDGAALLRSWDADPSNTALMGAFADYLEENRDIIRPTCNEGFWGFDWYERLVAYLRSHLPTPSPKLGKVRLRSVKNHRI